MTDNDYDDDSRVLADDNEDSPVSKMKGISIRGGRRGKMNPKQRFPEKPLGTGEVGKPFICFIIVGGESGEIQEMKEEALADEEGSHESTSAGHHHGSDDENASVSSDSAQHHGVDNEEESNKDHKNEENTKDGDPHKSGHEEEGATHQGHPALDHGEADSKHTNTDHSNENVSDHETKETPDDESTSKQPDQNAESDSKTLETDDLNHESSTDRADDAHSPEGKEGDDHDKESVDDNPTKSASESVGEEKKPKKPLPARKIGGKGERVKGRRGKRERSQRQA